MIFQLSYTANTFTCSCVGMALGWMLLPVEYTFGVCLSRLQRTHSVDPGWRCRPGNVSKHVLHLDTSSAAICAWNFRILACTERCWRSGRCNCPSVPCTRRSLWLSLSCCCLTSLSSAFSAASLSTWELLICCSLASLSSILSAATLSLIRCSLASLSSTLSAAALSLIRPQPHLSLFNTFSSYSVPHLLQPRLSLIWTFSSYTLPPSL